MLLFFIPLKEEYNPATPLNYKTKHEKNIVSTHQAYSLRQKLPQLGVVNRTVRGQNYGTCEC